MEKLVLPAFIALVVAFIFSNGFAALYNVFVGIPKGRRIKKEKNIKLLLQPELFEVRIQNSSL